MCTHHDEVLEETLVQTQKLPGISLGNVSRNHRPLDAQSAWEQIDGLPANDMLTPRVHTPLQLFTVDTCILPSL